jgi:hypothetical protein
LFHKGQGKLIWKQSDKASEAVIIRHLCFRLNFEIAVEALCTFEQAAATAGGSNRGGSNLWGWDASPFSHPLSPLTLN